MQSSSRSTLRELIILGYPTVLEQMLHTAVGYVDTAMVGQLGAAASAAVGLSTTFNWLFNGIFLAGGLGLLSYISRFSGAGDEESAHRTSAQGIWLVLMLGLPLTLTALLFSGVMPMVMGASEEIRGDGSAYFFIISLPLLLRGTMMVFGDILRANKDSKTPMKISVSVNILNIILNQLFIGTGTAPALGSVVLHLPGMGWGVRGAALATAMSQSLGGIAMFAAAMKNPKSTLRGQPLKPDLPLMRRVMTVSTPLLGERLVVCAGYITFTSVVASLGTVPMAAHTIAIQVEEAFYIPAYGIQTAVSTLSGNALGMQSREKLSQVVRAGMTFAVTVMTVMAVVLFITARPFMEVFTVDPQVAALGARVLHLVAVSEPLFAMYIIMEGVFHGIGETRFPFLAGLFSMWAVRVLLGWTLVHFFHAGLQTVWLCMICDNVSRCVLLNTWYLKGRWQRVGSRSF